MEEWKGEQQMNSTKNREKNDATTTTTTLFELIINDHEKFKGE